MRTGIEPVRPLAAVEQPDRPVMVWCNVRARRHRERLPEASDHVLPGTSANAGQRLGAGGGAVSVRRPSRSLSLVILRAGSARRDARCLMVRFSRSLARSGQARSEEHTSELQSLMRISYAVFCLKKKNPT